LLFSSHTKINNKKNFPVLYIHYFFLKKSPFFCKMKFWNPDARTNTPWHITIFVKKKIVEQLMSCTKKIVVPIDLAKNTFFFAIKTDFYSLVCHFTFLSPLLFSVKSYNNIFTLLYILLCHKKNKPGVNKRFCLQKCKLYIKKRNYGLIISCQFFENSSSCPLHTTMKSEKYVPP